MSEKELEVNPDTMTKWLVSLGIDSQPLCRALAEDYFMPNGGSSGSPGKNKILATLGVVDTTNVRWQDYVVVCAAAHKSNYLARRIGKLYPKEVRRQWRWYAIREFLIWGMVGGKW